MHHECNFPGFGLFDGCYARIKQNAACYKVAANIDRTKKKTISYIRNELSNFIFYAKL